MKIIQQTSLLLTLIYVSGVATLARASEIHQAAREGDVLKVFSLLKENPGLVDDVTTDDHSTPLHEAVRGGSVEVVRALIIAKANVNAKTTYGLTPLKLAKGYVRTEIASILEANGGLLLEPPPQPPAPTPIVPEAQVQRAVMPRYTIPLRGDIEFCVVNSSKSAVTVRILSGNAGADLYIAAGARRSVLVPVGLYQLYYIFSDDPSALYQGDDVEIPWNATRVSIQLNTGHGNYSIRRVN